MNKRTFYKVTSERDELGQLFDYDEQKFRQGYVSDINTANQTQLAAKLVFSSHSLEKSLSNDGFETGHGFRTAQLLISMLKIYKDKNYDQKHLAYVNTLSALKAFYDRHAGTKYVSEIEEIFDDLSSEVKECESKIGGSDEILLKDKKNNSKKNFKDLAEGRFAVRTYSKKPVNKKDIEEAIAIATKTPTVCNRQSIHVHAIYKKEIIEKVLEVQGGIAYYDTPPVLLLITADDNGYVGANERNQGFIDGGLFAMSVLYALEYKKLAACPLHAMFTEIPEMTIRGMLGLPDSEKLITFISVGHFNEKNQVCKSFRYPTSHILFEKNEIHDYSIEIINNQTVENEIHSSFVHKFRKKIRPRTRIKSALRIIKHKTRVRTRIRKVMSGAARMKDSRKYRNADGAILTLTGYYNYGNIIQRYALQEFLRQSGLNFVSYWHEQLIAPNTHPERLRYTKQFVDKWIVRKQFDPGDNFPAYIVGSDQVWRNWGYLNEKDDLGYYFLNFTQNKPTKRIAYAASLGQNSLTEAMVSDDFIKYVEPLIQKFDGVSMREKSGAEAVRKAWGIKAAQVIDPTMLLTSKDYDHLIKESPYTLTATEPIFTYVLIDNEEKTRILEEIKKATNLKANGLYLENPDTLPPIEQWLKGFRDAELVVTDSFHGMVFSIINNTPFVVLESEAGGVARIISLLSQLGLEDRLVRAGTGDKYSFSAHKPINWTRVNKRLSVLRQESGNWLLDILKERDS